MKSAYRNLPRRSGNQAGISLIELMIAMVLGLIVVTALMNMYMGSTRSATFSEGLRTMQENGRHGVQVLKRGIRLAGYSPVARIPAFNLAQSGDSKLVVRMVAQQDCNGGSTATVGGVAVNTYELNTTTEQITCTGNGPGAMAMPVIDGVEDFRVLYGVDADDDNFPESYRNHAAVSNVLQIRSIRFALLVTSQEPIRSRPVTETHVMLDNEVSKSDRRMRHVFSTTVMLRNLR
ncbi:MAG: PilW family protein [Granulosicoccus sp.]|nr:PilW family protein [Granulosicoccus sp.]